MITTKERAKLRAIAQKTEPLVLIGKGGISDTVLESINLLLDKRELIKIRLLQNSGLDGRPASDLICQKLGADGVQCIGNIVVIYKRSNRKDIKHVLWCLICFAKNFGQKCLICFAKNFAQNKFSYSIKKSSKTIVVILQKNWAEKMFDNVQNIIKMLWYFTKSF